MSLFSAREQYFLELVNRARLDPQNEAARLLAHPAVAAEVENRKDRPNPLNLDFAPGIEGLNRWAPDPYYENPFPAISGLPLQPLAPNGLLRDAASGHSDWMLDADIFSHTGENGSSAGGRVAAAGYVVVWPGGTGENLSWRGTTGSMDMDAAVINHHAGLFASDGHRFNTLTDWFRETGVAQLRGDYSHTNGLSYDSSMLTQKFAASGAGVFLTGVAYGDTDGDGFYSIGEGQAGVTIATVGNTTLTAPAGGYALGLIAAADVAVTLTWGAVQIGASVDLLAGNAKLDLVAGTGGVLRLLSSADMDLGAGAGEGALLGAADLALTGNAADNLLIGNRGDNLLRGGGGDDTLVGGAGDDVLDGGAGVNTARFSGNRADYLISADGAATLVADQRTGTALVPHDGTDRLTSIRHLEFADQSVDLAPEGAGTFLLSGSITIRGPAAISPEGVSVRFTAEGGATHNTTAGADGTFSFEIAANVTGSLDLVRNYSTATDKTPGINDVLASFRMIAGVSTPTGPEALVAADYDSNGTANIADVLALFRHVAGVAINAPRFVFVEDGNMPEGLGLTDLPQPGPMAIAMAGDMDLHFTAILTGDLNGYT